MQKGYSVVPHFDNSWHVKYKGEVIAHVEGIDKIRDGKQVTKGLFKKKPVNVYVVTHLPGASNEEFLTVHSAATHAASHHNSGRHLKVDHPIHHIQKSISELESVIWKAASDPRMGAHQEKLLQVSKSHAALRNTFTKHFGEDTK